MKRTAMMQVGGAATGCDACTQPIFHIYTTGLCDLSSYGEEAEDSRKLLTWWNTNFKTIIDKIPKRFSVHVHHYDKCDPTPKPYEKLINPRVEKSVFLNKHFDYNPESPHIIFDFAHNVHYHEHFNTVDGKVKGVKAIYGGYLGDGDGDVGLWTSFTVDESGKVTTFIDKLIEKGTKFEAFDPPKLFTTTALDMHKNEMINAVPEVGSNFTQKQRSNKLNEIDDQFSNSEERKKMIQHMLELVWRKE
jgi:hypothetical protein